NNDADMDQDSTEEKSQQDSEQGEERAEGELPETIVLNEQSQHEKGMIFVLEEIRFEEDHIQVDFNAENHTGYSQVLASAGEAKGTNLGGITIQDDTGFEYRYIANDNARIEIDDREKISGTVSFTGTIQEDAQSITLIFNPDREFEFAFENLELVW